MLMRNPFSRIPQPRECTSNHGDSVKIIYRGRYKDDGTVELVKSDELDIQKEINSFAGQCDLRYLMQRFNCGDVSVIQQGKPMYGDFSTIPDNFLDLYNMVHEAEQYFQHLPAEIKQSFDNNAVQWFASMGDESWHERMNKLNPISYVESDVVKPNVVKPDVVKPNVEFKE